MNSAEWELEFTLNERDNYSKLIKYLSGLKTCDYYINVENQDGIFLCLHTLQTIKKHFN